MNAKSSLRVLLPAAALLLTTGVSVVSAEMSTYEEQLRQWTSPGYRVQASSVHLFSLDRTDSRFPNINAEVAGVQLGPDGAFEAEPPSYAEQLRQFTGGGYRIQPGFVNTSAIARR